MWIRWRDGNTLDSGLIKVFYNIHGTECSKFALDCERQPSANEWKSPRFPSQIIAPHFVTRSRYSLDNFQTINNWRKRREKKNGEICEYLETRAEARTYMYAPAGIKRSSRTDHGNLTRIVFATHCTVCIDNLKRLQKWSAV